MTDRLLSFDIEISNVFELAPGENIDLYSPFDISVAATVIDQGEQRLWFTNQGLGLPAPDMNQETATMLLSYLYDKQQEGYRICAWNGLGFDFKWLAYASGDLDLAAEVAIHSYDPMFQFFNQRGFPVSLSSVAQGMNIGITKLMDGKDAPIKWRDGDYREVMDYVLGDCCMTNKIVNEIVRQKEVCWITSTGKRSRESFKSLKPVYQVLEDPAPNQSWMDKPISKRQFYSWILDT